MSKERMKSQDERKGNRGVLAEQPLWSRLNMYNVTKKEFMKFKVRGDIQISKGRAGISFWVWVD